MIRLKIGAVFFAGTLVGTWPCAVWADGPQASPEIIVNVAEQELRVVKAEQIVAKFPISTSKFGLGDDLHSYKTPVGIFEVCDKAGGKLPVGAVLKGGSFTGEVLEPNAPGRDAIVSRMIRLRGTESQNRHTLERGIFIHGTPEEKGIGKAVSWGCIRMRSKDVVELYKQVQVGTRVVIRDLGRPQRHWLDFGSSFMGFFGIGTAAASIADGGVNTVKGANPRLSAASPSPVSHSASSVPTAPAARQLKLRASSTIDLPSKLVTTTDGTQYLAE